MTQEQQIVEVLFNRGTLFDLFIGKPTFQKKLRPNDVLLEGIDENVLYLGHKKLLPKKAMERLVTLEGQARTALSNRSIPFPLSGARFVYYDALQDILEELQGIKIEWDRAVDELYTEYPKLKEEQLSQLENQAMVLYSQELAKLPQPQVNQMLAQQQEANLAAEWNEKKARLDSWLEQQKAINQSLYPNVEEVKGLFSFQWRMFKVSGLSGGEEMSTLDAQALLRAQQQVRQDLENWVRQAATEMHRTLGEAAANAKRLLEKNDKLNPRNIKPLFDAFETFNAIDFTGASTVHQTIERIKQTFGRQRPDGTVDMELTNDAIHGTYHSMNEFKSLLGTLSTMAVNAVAEEAGIRALSVGEFRRVVEL